MQAGCALQEFIHLFTVFKREGVLKFRSTCQDRSAVFQFRYERLKREAAVEEEWKDFRMAVVQEDLLIWTLYESVRSICRLCDIYPEEYMSMNIEGLKELAGEHCQQMQEFLVHIDQVLTVVPVALTSSTDTDSPASTQQAHTP